MLVRLKTAARTFYSGTRGAAKPTPRLLYGETVSTSEPGPGGGAAGGLPPSALEPPPTEPVPPAEPAPAVEPAPPVEGAAPVEPAAPVGEGVPAEPSGVGSWGLGGAALNVGLPLVQGYVHKGAVERQRDTQGYAPVGALAYAHENVLTRVGRVLSGAVLETQDDLRGRFNTRVWRDRVRSEASKIPPGGSLLIYYQYPHHEDGLWQQVGDDPALYLRQADGSWKLAPEGAKLPDHDFETVLKGLVLPKVTGTTGVVTPPDLNKIIGPSSDSEIETEELHFRGPGSPEQPLGEET